MTGCPWIHRRPFVLSADVQPRTHLLLSMRITRSSLSSWRQSSFSGRSRGGWTLTTRSLIHTGTAVALPPSRLLHATPLSRCLLPLHTRVMSWAALPPLLEPHSRYPLPSRGHRRRYEQGTHGLHWCLEPHPVHLRVPGLRPHVSFRRDLSQAHDDGLDGLRDVPHARADVEVRSQLSPNFLRSCSFKGSPRCWARTSVKLHILPPISMLRVTFSLLVHVSCCVRCRVTAAIGRGV